MDLDNKVHCCRRFFIWLNVVSVFGLRIPSYSSTETFGPMGGKFRKVIDGDMLKHRVHGVQLLRKSRFAGIEAAPPEEVSSQST